jgi:hypothetical protein
MAACVVPPGVSVGGVFGAVVEIAMLAMLHARQHLPLGCTIVFEFIRNDHPWHMGQALNQLAEEFLRGVLVPPTLHEGIEDVALLIHRPPEVVAFTMGGEEHFIQMPLVAGLGPPTSELIGIRLAELLARLVDGFVGDDDSTGKQQLFDITIAQAEAVIQPDAAADDLSRARVVFIRVGRG